MRELLGEMVNGAMPAPDASWGSIAGKYPGAISDLVHADGGFVRHGSAWYSAAFLVAGLLALFVLGRGSDRGPAASLLTAGAVAGIAYVLVVPVFSAFRLELVLVPMAACGIALIAERAAARVSLPLLARRSPVLTGEARSS
jgi:hypothetical protein